MMPYFCLFSHQGYHHQSQPDSIFTNRFVLTFRGFFKLKKSEKNSEVDWWVYSFFENVVFFVLFVFFCCCTCFQKNIKLNGGWVLSDQFVFISDFFILFNLTKTLTICVKTMQTKAFVKLKIITNDLFPLHLNTNVTGPPCGHYQFAVIIN